MLLSRLILIVVLTSVALPVQAQSFRDEKFATAVGLVVATDALAAHCPEASQPGTASFQALKAWEARNQAEAIRRAATAAQARDGNRAYQQLQTAVDGKLSPLYAQGCTALATWVGSEPSHAAAHWQAPAAVAKPVAAPVAKASAAPVKGILGYGLIQTTGMGYGGMVTIKFVPVVLFSSGDILLDVKGLSDPAGHRAANPEDWSSWRKTTGAYEYRGASGQWRPILGNKVWTTLADTSGLHGRFKATGGGGNLAVGGTDAVFVETSYTFLPGGRIVRDGVAGASSSFGSASTVTGANSGRTGRYLIDGLTLKITYDNGAQESLILMTHPDDGGIIWLDGTAYTRD
ncbi:hypothetical protein ABI_11770 [Asticcacaulis biprosthecium C19]|uniref:Uncharacterized protein n=1 Tax=Asticcacaulis biprosthecium C19 TaxID=715226 RepID=F4QHK3_9CAUL|nr:hypothetical protein [Asticcacaulis biprosthecium]EGF92740.1 hypothetical protein ABI_11770 [Asticcacaulis biprosthecium C19]